MVKEVAVVVNSGCRAAAGADGAPVAAFLGSAKLSTSKFTLCPFVYITGEIVDSKWALAFFPGSAGMSSPEAFKLFCGLP